MPFLTVTVETPENISKLSEKLLGNMASVYRNAGVRLARCIRNHMRLLSSTRHDTANKLGATPTGHFRASDVLPPNSTNSDVSVTITTPGIGRAYHDIDIDPVNGQFLAIPLHADSYGISPREYSERYGKLFRINRPGSTEKGKVLYTKDVLNGKPIPMYALTAHVHQVRDSSLMPTNAQMTEEAINGALAAIKQILKQ